MVMVMSIYVYPLPLHFNLDFHELSIIINRTPKSVVGTPSPAVNSPLQLAFHFFANNFWNDSSVKFPSASS